jgi:putative thioredoxin
MATTTAVFDATAQDFDRTVVARSHELPVVVDFWAAWCGPCRTLGPTLEAAVAARAGEVLLAKVDVDADPSLSQEFRVQGIPAVKAFRDGVVVAEFTGAVNAAEVERFLDGVVPSAADRLAATATELVDTDPSGAVAAFTAALDHDPGHAGAALGLAGLLVGVDDERARALVSPHRPDPRAEAVLTLLELAAHGGDVASAAAAVDAAPDDDAALLALGRAHAAAGEHGPAIEALLLAIEVAGDHREDARAQLVALFDLLGDDELVRAARPRLARALF